jgi:hypothetical protein
LPASCGGRRQKGGYCIALRQEGDGRSCDFFASVQLSCNERSSSAFSWVAIVTAAKPQLADSPEGMNDGFDA